MAEKSIAQKLQIKPGTSVWTSRADEIAILGAMPDGVRTAEGIADADVALLFVDDAAALRSMLTEHAEDLGTPTALWIAYRKGNRADINRDTLWPIAGGFGLRPNTQVALDETWSALRFRPLRPGEAQFSPGA